MRRRYHILDVFTDTKLAGNPLAVVLDSDGLDATAMQKIALEFNLSETVFCAPPLDPVNSAALRIFTPRREMPFAGHPTVGTAILLATQQAPDLLAREDVGLVLEERIGLVNCSVRHRRGEAPHARFEAPQVAEPWGGAVDAAEIAAALGLATKDVGYPNHRVTRFTAGNPAIFVPVASLEALGRARPLGVSTEREIFYLYTPATDGAAGSRVFRSRMLALGVGIQEDPATGSAAAAFPGCLHANERLADGEHDCVLLQGVEMGRPSRIGVAFAIEAGRIVSTAIGGSAVMVAQGILEI